MRQWLKSAAIQWQRAKSNEITGNGNGNDELQLGIIVRQSTEFLCKLSRSCGQFTIGRFLFHMNQWRATRLRQPHICTFQLLRGKRDRIALRGNSTYSTDDAEQA